jgi:hypothetical protein
LKRALDVEVFITSHAYLFIIPLAACRQV